MSAGSCGVPRSQRSRRGDRRRQRVEQRTVADTKVEQVSSVLRRRAMRKLSVARQLCVLCAVCCAEPCPWCVPARRPAKRAPSNGKALQLV